MAQAAPTSTTRRAFLSATAATAAVALIPTAAHADAAIFAAAGRIGPIADRLNDAITDECRADERFFQWKNLNPAPRGAAAFTKWLARQAAARQETGQTTACERSSIVHDEMSEACTPIADTPATTLAGLICKAKVAEHDERIAASILDDLLAMGA